LENKSNVKIEILLHIKKNIYFPISGFQPFMGIEVYEYVFLDTCAWHNACYDCV